MIFLPIGCGGRAMGLVRDEAGEKAAGRFLAPGGFERENGGVKKVRKPSPTESRPLFEIDPEPVPETLTAWGGVPLLVRAFRWLGLAAQVRQHVRIKERERGYDEATMVESFVVLNAVGGASVATTWRDCGRIRD